MNETDISAINAKMVRQNVEFASVTDLAEQWRRLQLTTVVDDDYPAVRSSYEGAMNRLLKACAANGRELYPQGSTLQINGAGLFGDLLREITKEHAEAADRWPPMNSAHEGYAVLAEEMDELWQHVKTKQSKRDLSAMKKEAIQVAAMALRFAMDVCNETRGRK